MESIVQSALVTSIIITSYQQERTLRLLFASLERQTFKAFEVLIADDGSNDGTEALCAEVRGFRLVFLTQKDLGYRKSKILNRAVQLAQTDYLIFLDGDVVLERHFVEDHLRLKKIDHFVCGRRVDLSAKFTQSVTLHSVLCGQFDTPSLGLILSGIKNESSAVKRAFRISDAHVRRMLKYDRPLDLLGSNFSVWKADLEQVNGFNESLESYWGEDGDLYIRLKNSGKKSIGAKALCIQYHFYHPRREPTKENVDRYYALLQNPWYRWAPKGYLESLNQEVE